MNEEYFAELLNSVYEGGEILGTCPHVSGQRLRIGDLFT